jgi:asparagine synthase (glutamine-hydrolysing)
MCGIVGILYFDRERKVPLNLVKAMADSIRHRGPDDEGFYINGNAGLGHRRLSIIDLSSGKQPIGNEDGSCQIVFNGEIYNYKSLRQELASKGHVFRTQTDTEVIIHCYEEYGEDCVKKLNGMFAFAIWDSKRRRLFLARDHIGIKPLYYYADQEKLVFGSELKAILQHPGIEREVDPIAMDAYFSYMYIPDPMSIFKSIRKLEAGHTLVCQNGSLKIKCYWDVANRGTGRNSEREWLGKVESLLSEATSIQLMSDVPLGAFLSGGIDSSSLVGLMARHTGNIQTFSMSGGKGLFNELPFARTVASRYGTEHHELEVPEENLEKILPDILGHLDEPMADSSIIPTYMITKFARERVKVVLSGEGADELFGGYTWHKKHLKIDRYRSLLPHGFRQNLLNTYLDKMSLSPSALSKFVRPLRSLNNYSLMESGHCFELLRRLFMDSMKEQVYGDKSRISPENSLWAIRRAFERNPGVNALDNALYADLKVYLPGDLLTKVDRMSMANSLEVRVPFLDYRVVELAASIPANLKIRGGLTKYILRKAMEPLLPDAVKNRKIKRGFSVPVMDWFRGNLRQFAHDVLLDSKTTERGFFRTNGVRKMLEDHQKGQPYGDQIFLMIVFELWARQYLDGTAKPIPVEVECLQN